MSIRDIPNMNSILEHPLFEGIERARVKHYAELFLSGLREELLSGTKTNVPALDECTTAVLEMISSEHSSLRGVINATGVVLHTNLGRAPLGEYLYSKAEEIYKGYCNLEYELENGRRGSRYSHIEGLICELTGAEAAVVVNNNAAAVLLILSALAKGKRVAISRGELVEIGGSFRVPEIMEQSGAELYEIGTTNRTHPSDYISAADNGAEIIMKVHTSNFKIVGFTKEVSVAELAVLGRDRGIPVFYDMGSCFLLNPELLGLHDAESARSGIEAGADLICFSGDKLLGSAQAGIIAGKKGLIDIIKSHPLMRALRPDKLCLAALEATLSLCRYPNEAKDNIPTLAMLSATPEELEKRANALATEIQKCCPNWHVTVRETDDETGGGSLPNLPLKGWAVAVVSRDISVQELERRLRSFDTPIIVRINEDAALFSVRTLFSDDTEIIVRAFSAIYK